MNFLGKINSDVTIIISLVAIFIGFTYFFVNKSYSSFKNSFKIGYNEGWNKYEVTMTLIIFFIGFVIGLFFCIQMKNIFEIDILRIIALFSISIIIISDIALQYNFRQTKNIIKMLSGCRSKLMNYILSISTWLFTLIIFIYGIMSVIPLFILVEDNNNLYLILAVLFAFIMWSFSFFGSVYNYISISKMKKKCIVLNDGKKYTCFIIGIESGFLVINRDKCIEHINLSLVNRILEEIE
jgi:hypothetical protein